MIDIEYTNRSVVTAQLAVFIRMGGYSGITLIETYCNRFVDEYCEEHPDYAEQVDNATPDNLFNLGNVLVTEYCMKVLGMTEEMITEAILKFDDYIQQEAIRPFRYFKYSTFLPEKEGGKNYDQETQSTPESDSQIS